MAYHTLTDLQNAVTESTLINLTDDDDAGVVDTDITDAAATHAAAVIDGKLRSRYTVPVTDGLELIKEVSVALAIYWLVRRRRAGEEMDKSTVRDRDNALRILDHLAEGKMDLKSTEPSGYQTNKTADDRVFPESVLNQF